MSLTNLLSDFLSAGLTPNEKGEFKVGPSEAGRLQAFYQHRSMMDDLEKPISFDLYDDKDDFK
jgi:hypothetical protein